MSRSGPTSHGWKRDLAVCPSEARMPSPISRQWDRSDLVEGGPCLSSLEDILQAVTCPFLFVLSQRLLSRGDKFLKQSAKRFQASITVEIAGLTQSIGQHN